MPSQNISGRNIRGENIASSGPPTENPTYDQPPSDRQQIDDGDALIAFIQSLFSGGDAQEPPKRKIESPAATGKYKSGLAPMTLPHNPRQQQEAFNDINRQAFSTPPVRQGIDEFIGDIANAPEQVLPPSQVQSPDPGEQSRGKTQEPPVPGPQTLEQIRRNRLNIPKGANPIEMAFKTLLSDDATPVEEIGSGNELLRVFLQRIWQMILQNRNKEQGVPRVTIPMPR